MEKEILLKVNQYIKKDRPFLGKNIVCDYFRNGSFLEIAFMSRQCRNDAKGTCIMCDYGAVYGAKYSELYMEELKSVLIQEQGIKYLLICTNGSIMDFLQFPETTFYEILRYVNETDIPNIIIETHYLDITDDSLEMIKKVLFSKNVIFELGLETANQKYQDYLIMKQIDMNRFKKTITAIQNFGFSVDLNILLGLPFLSGRAQFDDAKNAILWTFEQGCNSVVFPINIKPYTLLMNMYENNFYQPVSHWMLLLLLDDIPSDKLSQITISYYGNREDDYYGDEHKSVFPDCCHICQKPLFDFYDNFYNKDDAYQRKGLLKQILKFDKCDCLKKQRNLLELPEQYTFEEKYNEYTAFLKKNFELLI